MLSRAPGVRDNLQGGQEPGRACGRLAGASGVYPRPAGVPMRRAILKQAGVRRTCVGHVPEQTSAGHAGGQRGQLPHSGGEPAQS
jgi:hypothetical protein